jgi:hypothetical protein
MKGRNIWVMDYETTQWDKYSLHPSFKSFSFHTDTHYTQPRRQSNRRRRGTKSEWCITKQHSETNTLFIHRSTLSHFIQTLRQINLSANPIGTQGVQYLSDALQNNTVWPILSSSIIQLFLISYRHSLDSTSNRMISEMKGRNIWVMHYEAT